MDAAFQVTAELALDVGWYRVTTEPAHRRAARYAWALLLARIYEAFPVVCPLCGGEVRIIAF